MYNDTDRLAELMANKHRVLKALHDLGQRQAELIECNELDMLLKLLSGKQRLLDELLASNQRLAPFHSQDPQQRRWRSEALRASCSSLAADCERLLLKVVQQERACEQVMMQRRGELAERIDGAHAAAQVHGAYFSANQFTSTSLDLSAGN